MPSFHHHLALILLLVIAAGCSREEASRARRADEVFMKAKQAMLRADHGESKRLLREAVALYEEVGDASRHAETSLLLGETYASAAGFDSALTLFSRARTLYQQVSDKAGAQAAVFAQAALHRVRGEDQHAFSVLRDELRLEEAFGDTFGVRQLKWKLIPVSRALGDFALEQSLIQQLLSDYKGAHDGAMIARVHAASGHSSSSRSDHAEALKSYAAALPFAQHANDTLLTIQIYLDLAVAYDRLGKEHEAFQMFTEGIRRTDMIRGADALREEMLLRVGNVYLRRQRYQEAHKFFNAALRAAIRSENRLVEAYALLQLGHCLDGMEKADAETNYRAGAALLDHIGLPRARAYAQTCLGMFAQKKGGLNEALALFQLAASTNDSSTLLHSDDVFLDCENTFFRSRNASPYDLLIELLFQLGRADDAFAAAEMKRQNVFLRAFESMNIRTRTPDLNKALKDYHRARGASIGAERQLASAFALRSESRTLWAEVQGALALANARVSDLADSLAAAHPQLRAAFVRHGATVSEVQKQLSEGETFVAYIPAKQFLHIFIISKTTSGVHMAAIGKEPLLVLAREYLNELGRMNAETSRSAFAVKQNRLRELSGRLYNIFVRPIALNAPGAARLLVVLPTELPFIPLHALQHERYAGDYAIRNYAIRYLPDADALMLKRKRIGSYPLVVGFGNNGRTSIDAEYEVRDAKAFYKDARLYFDRNATLDRLRQESGDLLHVSFELQYRPEDPALSFFVLSDGGGYAATRYPRLGELFSVAPFPTVLFSNLANTEFHPVVPRMFLMNGSSDVVINSYVPQRKAKKFFNEILYTNLLAGSSTEVAYRNALLEMIGTTEYASPHLWGAFSLW